ncbi:5-formyltetrahydrofolate cyclo-ligase [Arcanobacterium sp. S3PF19]|uniref:5-formyltetrahydrofolate cyclo-ligase n=1 Tax=Arcanobacterium sp. S3PF19 TaxID=1219585 RepID=UPI00050FD326|nr:5-formyltetrahydrofolate cyclo-ligase [Arcanobacterium sp. S3PF19]KGF05832.1 5-formyltetrahydrofolate cyclo-ligase [Arcanobacterium sp. S3PF19]
MSGDAVKYPNIGALPPEDAKQQLRAQCRQYRRQRCAQEKSRLALQWQKTVLDFTAGAHTVTCFVSTSGEPPTYGLCKALADAGKTLLLPKLGPGLTRSWGYFRGLDDLVQLAPGRPPEPGGAAFDNDILSEVDAMIIPALLVSRFGERLGQGGGWYDRALKCIRPDTAVGAMVFPGEFVDFHLPQDDMDVPVPYAILPTRAEKTAV